jgi:hypothetical protein
VTAARPLTNPQNPSKTLASLPLTLALSNNVKAVGHKGAYLLERKNNARKLATDNTQPWVGRSLDGKVTRQKRDLNASGDENSLDEGSANKEQARGGDDSQLHRPRAYNNDHRELVLDYPKAVSKSSVLESPTKIVERNTRSIDSLGRGYLFSREVSVDDEEVGSKGVRNKNNGSRVLSPRGLDSLGQGDMFVRGLDSLGRGEMFARALDSLGAGEMFVRGLSDGKGSRNDDAKGNQLVIASDGGNRDKHERAFDSLGRDGLLFRRGSGDERTGEMGPIGEMSYVRVGKVAQALPLAFTKVPRAPGSPISINPSSFDLEALRDGENLR